MSDLRDSGAIEQDADVVMLIHENRNAPEGSEERNTRECIIDKNRHGATGTVRLAWTGAFTRFTTLENYRNE